ncbi:MAG: branched-chain amino acid transferase [Rhizobiales bacterium]|nr:branched-chain amino acid transferase [Hyphomicrobiales bacterium]
MTSDNPFAAGAGYMNGAFVPVKEARIPITDLGFIRSDATYDVVHVWKSRFFRLEDHVDRFLGSADKLRFNLPLDRDGLIAMLHRLVALTGLEDVYVSFTGTRGSLPPGSRNPLDCENGLYGFAIPFMWITPLEEQLGGIRMITASPERMAMTTFDQSIKNYMWGDLTAGMMEASDRGAKVPVLLDRNGNVTEGPGFNIFIIRGGSMMTPDTGVLQGITRRTAIELARDLNIETQIAPVPRDALKSADEIFITSTAGGIIPVTVLDDENVGDGQTGPVASRLHSLYWQAHQDPRYSTPVDYTLAEAAE